MAKFDPQQFPIDAIAGEPAVPAAHLAPDWLRARFAAPPAWEPEASEQAFAPGVPLKPAAVLVPLVPRPDGLAVLLTRRTEHLNHHAGQISFPGGRTEEYDLTPADTALREASEEIGLARVHADILGALPVYYTGTGYSVTPVVALLRPPFDLRADPHEVAEIFEVPLAFLMDGAHHQRLSFELAGARRRFYAMPYGDYYIWGATAGMLRNLFHFLRAV